MSTSATGTLSVPLLDLSAQYQPIRDEILQAITRVADSQVFILGPEVDALERELAAMLDVRHAIGISSGTDAVLVALMALGVGPGDEVIVPDYSFFATASGASRLGATPVFVDIDPATFNLDVDAVERALTPRTAAIIPVHLFGLPADMEPITAMAGAAGVPVVEDAAQAIGAEYRGRQVGSLGALGCFSFYPTKNLGAFGEGGLVTTNDDGLAHDVRLLRNHGAEPKYVHGRIGGNFRLDALQAAVLRVKAPHLAAWTEGRRRNAARYRALFQEYGLIGQIELPVEVAHATHIYNQFVIRAPERDRLREFLASRRVGTEIYYPIPFHRQACFAGLASAGGSFPVSDRAADTSLALPIYAELTDAQIRHVVASVAESYQRR